MEEQCESSTVACVLLMMPSILLNFFREYTEFGLLWGSDEGGLQNLTPLNFCFLSHTMSHIANLLSVG